jgi:hypothetical protein
MLFESEARTFFEISIWIVSTILVVASFLNYKRNKGGIYFLSFALIHFISLLGLKNLLNTIDTEPVMASENNTYRFYVFIFPWVLSMALLIIGIFKSKSKE